MRLGLRVQLVLALGILLAVAFVPLHFAVARLTQASLVAARRDAARDVGRAIAGHVLSARARPGADVAPLLDAQLSEGVVAIGVYDASGARGATAGEALHLPERVSPGSEAATPTLLPEGEGLLVVVPDARGSCALVLRVDPSPAARNALVGLVALYTGVVALALLVFAYFAMTRLVVRPVDELSNAAARVAGGARSVDFPESGARELRDLAASLRAMTERLLADEQALRAKVGELERTTTELASANETVIRSERLASVGRLAAGMAHEIGNPLAALLGLQELLLSGELSDEERRDVLERMKRETERIHRVLRDLLDFARTPDRAATEKGAADVAKVVDAVRALVAPQRTLRDVAIEAEVEPELPRVAMPEERLQQVVLNVLLNAGDAVPPSGGRVVIRARATAGGGVAITVDDNGPGIDAGVMGRLFEPFVTTKEVGKGTGLGLAVCRGLVEAAGGTIAAGRSPQGGARFSIELPAAPPEAPTSG